MAGSNQAVNLGGMLSQIGGAVGEMGAVGENFTRPVQNMSRPNVDPNDPEGLKRLMQWQQQMGREDAARTTMAQYEMAEEKRKEAATMEAVAAIYEDPASALGNEAIVQGDREMLRAANERYARDINLASKTGNLQLVEKLVSERQQLNSAQSLAALDDQKTQKQATGIIELERLLKNNKDLTPDQRTKIQGQVDKLSNNTDARHGASIMRVEQAGRDAAMQENEWNQVKGQAQQELIAAKLNPEGMDAWNKKYGKYAGSQSMMQSVNTNLQGIEDKRIEANNRAAIKAASFDDLRANLESNELLSDDMRTGLSKLIAAKEKEHQQAIDAGVPSANHFNVAQEAILSATIRGAETKDQAAAQSRVEKERYLEGLRQVVGQGPAESQVLERAALVAESKGEDFDPADPDHAAYIEAARDDLWSESEDILLREQARLSDTYIQPDDGDQQAIVAMYESGVPVEEIFKTTGRLRYDYEAVKDVLLSKANADVKASNAKAAHAAGDAEGKEAEDRQRYRRNRSSI